MEKFERDSEVGDIHFRDRWQFELKSDFTSASGQTESRYVQEFYIFIPKLLQVNDETYPREQFYRDQTNIIRYKTPVIALDVLVNPNNKTNPLSEIIQSLYKNGSIDTEKLEYKLKLFGNIVKSALRREVNLHMGKIGAWEESQHKQIEDSIISLCDKIQQLHSRYEEIRPLIFDNKSLFQSRKCYEYVDEFISKTIDYSLCVLLERLRQHEGIQFSEADKKICALIQSEKNYRIAVHQEAPSFDEKELNKEFILYRNGLLSQYVLDALQLSINRSSIRNIFQNVAGAVAAGIAMLIYLILFVWQGEIFLINSTPFIVFTVVLYILKDRVKEGLRTYSYQHALKWFSDYKTEILSEDEGQVLGSLKESFTYIKEKNLSQKIVKMRNKGFHEMVSAFKRPESVIYYKRIVSLQGKHFMNPAERYGLSMLFRLNIAPFLEKASNPRQSYLILVPGTSNLETILLPKIYHLNIIMKNTYTNDQGVLVTEHKKYRLIVDKNGIKHVEKVYLKRPEDS